MRRTILARGSQLRESSGNSCEFGAGKIEIQVDGQLSGTADLSTTGARLPQQLVSQVTGLTSGQHTLSIINRGPGPVAVDAIVVK